MMFTLRTLTNSRSLGAISRKILCQASQFPPHEQRRKLSFLGDTFKKIKQYIKPDPMYEVKNNVNKMIDESTKEFTGISGFFARKLMKKFAQLSIDESSYQIQWIHQIKELAEEIIILEKENIHYFGSSIKITNVLKMNFVQINNKNYFELTCPIEGHTDQKRRKGQIYLKGHMNSVKGEIIFDEVCTYNEKDQIICRQTFDEEDQSEYYNKHPQRKKVIDIKGVEVK